MGTKFASYTLKLTLLHEYYQRLLHGSQPIPSGFDMANTLKYFLQSLLSLLRDVEKSPYEMLRSQKMDSERMCLYPNLDYKQLYNALSQLIDVIPSIHTGVHVFGQTLLQCLACLLPFLEHDLIDNLPYITANLIAVLPEELHQEIINYLCYYMLPFTISRIGEEIENYASQSVSAIIMLVLEYSNNSGHHCQLLECLMALKSEVSKDILCVIAYGTRFAKTSATKLLFYYWPTFNPKLFDRKSVLMKFTNEFTPFTCKRDDCPNSGSAEAGKVCYNHSVSITFASDSPPPLYLCIECANEIHRENPNQIFHDIVHPMQQVSLVCENKNCRASDKAAISVCFSIECTSYNSNHPIRYCQQCHNIRHNNRRGGDHVFHTALVHISKMDSQSQLYMIQAIISLLKEAETLKIDNTTDVLETYTLKANPIGTTGCSTGINSKNCESSRLEERQLLGRYGVWLLVGLCTPDKELPIEILGRLLSMLFHWFYITAYTFDGTKKSLIHLIFTVGQAESILEKLKTDYVCHWLLEIKKQYYNVFVSCLLPHPVDYVRVGGHWETLASRTSHLKDGLNRLFCLVPYEIITPDIWDYVMPYWMEAIVNDVPIYELQELKLTLCKILDPDMSPLGFDVKKMYNFVAKRFNNSNAIIQEQALNWLQMLTILDIIIPIPHLFSMFYDGISVNDNINFVTTSENNIKTNSNQKDDINDAFICYMNDNMSEKITPNSEDGIPISSHNTHISSEELNLSCCILMLDILLKQMELQNVDKHTGVNSWICKDACHLLKSANVAQWSTQHTCTNITECSFCESSVIWHQLCLQLLIFIAPKKLAYPPDTTYEEFVDVPERKSPLEKKHDNKPDVVINMPMPELHSVGGVLVHMPHFFEQIMTATVETVSEQLDLANIIPIEKTISTVSRNILTETDVATAAVGIKKSSSIEVNNKVLLESDNNLDAKKLVDEFKFSVNDLPDQLQYIYKLFKELSIIKNPDILCYMLECLNMMCLYGDILNIAIKDHQGFFIWCQENILMKNLWDLLNGEYSHIAQKAVPLLLHCITLPFGIDTFWHIVQDDFHSNDWRTRFTAVERVTLIARFMDFTPLKNIFSLQTSLANIFCYLINSMDDSNVYVAQKATLYLGTIHDTAIKALIMCMETQFDLIIVDRPIILQSLYQLHNCLSDRRILCWEFFFNRFETLFIEAQINLEKISDINNFRDLKNIDLGSDVFLKKIQRAHEALSKYDRNCTTIKTLSSSFGTKWPYKRTMSAPASMILKQDIKQDKEKLYSRQISAPNLKRKSSRFGLGQLIGYTLPNSSITEIHIPSLSMVEEGYLPSFMPKIIEFEESDKETAHLLVFLLMQFLSRPDQAYTSNDKSILRIQGIVLRHLYLMLGYNHMDKNFSIASHKLRSSAVFNVFMTYLPQVLDQNHNIGLFMIQPLLSILKNASHPPQKTILIDNIYPTYSLWHLEVFCRRSWLMSVLVILYKYESGQQQWCKQLQVLIKIVLHTLDSQYHQCKHVPSTVIMSTNPSRSRDMSQPSFGVDHEIISSHLEEVEQNSISFHALVTNQPTTELSLNDSIDTNWEKLKLAQRNLFSSHSLNIEDIDSELAAIPESPKSENLIRGQKCSREIQGIQNDTSILSKKLPISNTKLYKEDNLRRNVKRNKFHQSYSTTEGKLIRICSSAYYNEEQKCITNESEKTDSNYHPAINELKKNPNLYLNFKNINRTNNNTDFKNVGTEYINLKNRSFDNKNSNILHENPEKVEANDNIHLKSVATSAIIFPDLMSRDVYNEQTALYTNDSHSSYNPCNNSINRFISTYDIHIPITIPAMERLLPIGSSVRTNAQVREQGSKVYASHYEYNLQDISDIEIPLPERLLRIGSEQVKSSKINDHSSQTFNISKISESNDLSATTQNSSSNFVCFGHSTINKKSLTTGYCFSTNNDIAVTHTPTPKKLIKQIALESPSFLCDLEERYNYSLEKCDKIQTENRSTTTEDIEQSILTYLSHSSEFCCNKNQDYGPHLELDIDYISQQPFHADFDLKQSILRIGDECNYKRCSECGLLKEEYTDEELGLCIIIIGTFIHREPCLAASLLPEILNTITKVSINTLYSWQSESNIYLPGGAVSVSHQFLRCVLHQMAPNGIFMQMFQRTGKGSSTFKLFKSISQALVDFNELNSIAPLQILIESLNSKKSLPIEHFSIILRNIAYYLDCLPLEAGLGSGATTWGGLILQFDGLFRRLILILSTIDDISSLLKIMISILKVSVIQQSKGLLDPFSKILSYIIQNSVICYNSLIELCCLCHRNFTRDREKYYLSRTVVFELIQAIKFKTTLPDANFLLLLQFVLQDAGGLLLSTISLPKITSHITSIYNTNASESLRNQLSDIIDFLIDANTSNKIKSFTIGMQNCFNEDTLSGQLKCGLAQYLALEISKGNARENRAISRYLPWLYNTSSSVTQGSREYLDYVNHIRLLSWILLGSLTYSVATVENHTMQSHGLPLPIAQPIPQEASCYIVDHVQAVLSAFPDQYKSSVINISSLFHVFNLCQLWTLYLEDYYSNNTSNVETNNIAINILLEFWSKVTPHILQLVSHSKIFADIVNIHFLSLLEMISDCGCTVLNKLLPIWNLIIFSDHIKLPRHLHLRLQLCTNISSNKKNSDNNINQDVSSLYLLQWLRKLEFKMSMIELQSSNATPFYSL